MFNISKQRIIIITVVALAVTTSINFYHTHNQKKEQEAVAKLREINQRLVAKNTLTARLNKAEDMLMKGSHDVALPIIREIAEGGNVRAQHDLGWAYRQGIGVEQNYVQALNWFTKAAEAGEDPDSYSASYYVGEIYYNGFGAVKADREKAIKWFERAKEHGVKEAAQYLKKIEQKSISS